MELNFQKALTKELKRFICEEEGQALVEYTLIISLISVVAIPALTKLGEGVSGVFTAVVEALN